MKEDESFAQQAFAEEPSYEPSYPPGTTQYIEAQQPDEESFTPTMDRQPELDIRQSEEIDRAITFEPVVVAPPPTQKKKQKNYQNNNLQLVLLILKER